MASARTHPYHRRMKVALMTDSVDAGAPGFANYAMELADELTRLLPDVTLMHRGSDAYYEGQRHETYAVPGPRPLRRVARQWALPPVLEARGFDLVHDTYHFGPFLRSSRYARVLTIGDLTPLTTNSHSRGNRLAHRWALPLIARRAHHIVTFSEASRRDITRLFGIDPERVTVTLLAAADRFRPATPAAVEDMRARLALPPRYLLFVGSIEPRKNVERLVRAYARALPALGDAPLVLVSRRSWRMNHLSRLVRDLGIEERVIRRTDIDSDDLPLVYAGATMLCYPSLYEGFGLPALEAMQCGLPVLTSNVSSLPEVTGDAAVCVDPQSVEEIAQGMVELASSDGLGAELSARGMARAARFSWRRCAEETASAYATAMVHAADARRN